MGGRSTRTRAAAATVALVGSALMLTAADWPTYLSDGSRDGTSSETSLSVSDAPLLSKLWSYQTGATIAASATVVSSVVYVGSWDGYEYALDAKSGALKWRTNLGITTGNSNCSPHTIGVSSAATVVGGTVYVGGGDAYWYALDAATGTVLWKVYTGDNSASGGHYNWASPLIYNGYAYIGISSLGDCPLVQGQLLQVSLSSHQVVNTFDVVPNGDVGGGIWTSPTVDPATNLIYVTTGTRANSSDLYAEAVLSINAADDTLHDSWPLPANQETSDSDWGTTPILLSDAHGNGLVAATNKNGYTYAFPRGDLHDGYTWRTQVANAGSCPQCGSGTASSMTFAGGKLFAAGGATTVGGTSEPGAVRALDPDTGSVIWAHATPAAVVPALASDNGLVIDAAGSTLEVLNAASGSRLYAFAAPGGTTFYGAPSISNAEIFAGSTDGNLYTVGLPAASGTTGPATSTAFSPQAVGAPTTATVAPNGAQLVFWKGAGSHLFEAWYSDGWNGPVDVSAAYLGGAVLASAPSVAVVATPASPDGAQVVFWEGAGGHLFEAWWEGTHGWNGPVDWTTGALGTTTFGGGPPPPLTSSPTVTATSDGTQIVFFRSGAANELYEAWYNGKWNGPVDEGAGGLASAPSATVLPNGTQVVCWQGQNGHLEEMQDVNSQGFGTPTDLTTGAFGGKALLTSAPEVASTPDNKQIVFWRAAGGHLDEAWFSSTWNGPVDLTSSYFHGAGLPNSGPAAAVTTNGTQIVFWQSTSSTLDEAWFTGTWNGPAQY